MRELDIYYSTGEKSLFVRTTEEQLRPADSDAGDVEVRLDESVNYQTMDGFGASFTDSAAYLIHQVLPEEQRSSLMKKLFDPEEGIGLSVLRNPMGASDYARFFYSYNDLPEGESDPEMQRFSIRHDEVDVIPLLKEALALNPSIKLFGSPWSAPGWMKTSGSMIGGELKKEYYEAYANYFVRYIESYAKHGLSIYAVTPQNEPLYVPGHYPGMLMTAEMQTDFVKNYLKPAFVKHGLSTKILAYDHNWDRPDYPLTVLKEAAEAVDGVAWHWYGGVASAQSQVKEAFPGKEVHFTEGSGGEWIPAFEPAFSNVMRTGIEILRNHSQSLVLWNMALDEQNGPTVPGFGRSTCRGIVTVNQQTRELEYTLDYYALAHFSKVIRPKAVRIAAESGQPSIRSVAFRNTDDSIGVVLFNDGEQASDVRLRLRGTELPSFRMESKSALSIRLTN
ncbi:glycoside hydrolase family 30 beta sandwich domain-containing protein [Paenibacillus phoenicis]|uniref:Glycoside hydrolase family 30 beta sandwich domain-containing protein n=1 Tax=Paenibacillus phoenicis TaxID=554117 RepID=A0ABU5PQV6_9BACL|nr:glycoside hydrolase family 30 beta sandwich domain-containing protein [Paenibacillus phoenicis]MEA3571999.1 glycoside hydrolase family 30 beta sandwich domain-containing protein [Paenibacillus phoenicis]